MLRHPHIQLVIRCLRPEAKPLIDFIIQDDGDGPYLVDGSMLNPPTQDEVDAVSELQLNAAQAGKSVEDLVNAERDRRIFSGFTFNGTRFQSRLEDQKRISGAAILAAVASMAGAQPGDLRWHGGYSDFAWIAEDNSLVPMDAQTVIGFGQAAAAHEAAHVFAARALKDSDPIPLDYASDQYWP